MRCWIKIVAAILITLLLLSVIYAFIIPCYYSQISWRDLIINWSFVEIILLTLTLLVVYSQLKKQANSETITALAKLRELLISEQNRKVHLALLPKEAQGRPLSDELPEKEVLELIPDWVDVFNYLGTLELGVIMMRKEVIDEDTFISQFGYRIHNVFVGTTNFHEKVTEYINSDKLSYKELLDGYAKIKDYYEK